MVVPINPTINMGEPFGICGLNASLHPIGEVASILNMAMTKQIPMVATINPNILVSHFICPFMSIARQKKNIVKIKKYLFPGHIIFNPSNAPRMFPA